MTRPLKYDGQNLIIPIKDNPTGKAIADGALQFLSTFGGYSLAQQKALRAIAFAIKEESLMTAEFDLYAEDETRHA